MGRYIDSKGNQKDTGDMDDVYLERALAKAQRENNQDNIDVLQAEVDLRNNG